MKKKKKIGIAKKTCFIIIKIIIILVLVIPFLLFVLGFFGMDASRLALEYIKVLVWPVFLFLVCGKLYLNEIRRLIERIKSLRGPAGIGAELEPPITQKGASNDIPKEEIKESIEKELVGADKKDSLLRENLELKLSIYFERVYNFIFGSQIRLLENLRLRGLEGDFYENLASYYQNIRRINVNLSSYSLTEYLNFLEGPASGLIEAFFDENNKKKYRINTRGIDFLEYIEKLNYSKAKFN